MTGRRVLRPATGTFWLVAVAVVVLFLLGDVVVRGSWGQALLIAPWLLIPVWFVYVFLFAPHLELDEEHVRVHNVLRTTQLPWSTVDEIVMRWQLEFHLTPDAAATGLGGRKGVVEAWSFSRRWGGAGRRRTDDTEVTLDVMRGLHASVGRQPDARPTVSWDVPSLVAGAVLAVACVASVAIAG